MPPKVDKNIHHGTTLEHWSKVPATDAGMLDEFTAVAPADIAASKALFSKLQPSSKTSSTPELPRAVDCGAGIGRVTLNFLSHVAQVVDIVEPMSHFTKEIESGEAFKPLRDDGTLGTIYNTSLQDWHPPEKHMYDLIWNQWCLLYLKDAELVAYLVRCRDALKQGGWLVVKENVTGSKTARSDQFDAEDSSVTRTPGKYKSLFAEAGFVIKHQVDQPDRPKHLFPVIIWALQASPESKR